MALVQSQVGRPDDGTDPCSFYNAEFSVPLRPQWSGRVWSSARAAGRLPGHGPLALAPQTKPELTKAR